MADPYLDSPYGLAPQPVPASQRGVSYAPPAVPQAQPSMGLPPGVPRLAPQWFPPALPPRRAVGPAFRSVVGGATSTAPAAPQPVGALPEIDAIKLTELIKQAESTGDYTAVNPSPDSTASGAYQYIDSTWGGYGGYKRAAEAPPAVQDEKFALDLARRMARYNNDPFKIIAAHYLPALADDPSRWTTPFTIGGTTVTPVAQYVRKVIADTPLEGQLDAYLNAHSRG